MTQSDEVERLYAAGYSVGAIRRMLKITEHHVLQTLKDRGVTMRQRAQTAGAGATKKREEKGYVYE